MNEELKQHALRIAEILQEQGNPYQRIEIDADGIKKVSTDTFMPAETHKDQMRLYGWTLSNRDRAEPSELERMNA